MANPGTGIMFASSLDIPSVRPLSATTAIVQEERGLIGFTKTH